MSRDAATEEFSRALRRLPPPVPCFSDGACCPWCGSVSASVTFGMNSCEECGKGFAFGFPEWSDGKTPVSWVPFPWKEYYALGERADLLPTWEPNERLQAIYFEQAEERLGIYADRSAPN
jgi:hypothetical protein